MNGLMQCNKPRAKINYRILEAKLVREIPRAERVEGLPPEEQDRIASTLLLETVVIDVDGLTEEDGTTPLKYTKDLGLQLLFDPDCKVFTAGCPAGRAALSSESLLAPTHTGTQRLSMSLSAHRAHRDSNFAPAADPETSLVARKQTRQRRNSCLAS